MSEHSVETRGSVLKCRERSCSLTVTFPDTRSARAAARLHALWPNALAPDDLRAISALPSDVSPEVWFGCAITQAQRHGGGE